MNEQNLEYLQNNLKYLGFGETLNKQLADKIASGIEAFNLSLELSFPKANKKDNPELADKVAYELDFSKSRDTDMYFFNKYTASLEKGSEILNQTFYINKAKGVTAKESFNLLDDRSVNKDVVLKSGEKANLWMKLDFTEHKDGNFGLKTFGEKYGFNLAETVDKFKIVDIEKLGFKDQLLKSLEKGNLHEVSFSKDGKELNGFVAANPQFKTLDFYDGDLKTVYSKAVDLRMPGTSKHENINQVERTPELAAESENKKGRSR